MDRILEQVQSGDFDPLKMFTGDKDKFLEVKTAIENISDNLTKETCIEFLRTKIIPTAFDKNISDAARDEAVEVGFHFLKFVNISTLGAKEQETVFTAIEETYTKTVGELRDNNYANWDKLWIFLIRLCHEKIHSKLTLANKLLRVVEMAFRNSTSVEQRLKAYDCWKELIDNSSLNMEHMCSAKQIKLLVTPLKAKFSRMPVVINKRCDIFVYLLEKLEDKATLCLKEFLVFCFGPFDERNDVEKMRLGKSVSDVCVKGTKVLIEIIGHSHSDSENNCILSDNIKLHKSVINSQNFQEFAEILINSIVECCTVLTEWNTDSSQINIIIKCLWRSLLKLIYTSNDEVKKKCYTQINNLLRKLLNKSEYNKHCLIVLGNVIELLLKDDLTDNLREILFDVAMNLLCNVSISSCSFNIEELINFIGDCFNRENTSKFAKIAGTYFKKDVKCLNCDKLCEVWLKTNIPINSGNIFNLIWPICNFKDFKNVDALKSKWTTLYTNECKSELIKASVIQEMEKLFLENPLLNSNIIVFLVLITKSEQNSTKEFVCKVMRLVQNILTLPNLSETDLKKLSSTVLSYCNQNLFFYKSEFNDDVIDKLCGCLEQLITVHKDYSVLPELHDLLRGAQVKTLMRFSKRLMTQLEALMLNEDNTVANNTRKLLELLESKDSQADSMPLASTRSLRIVNMVAPKKANNLRLFGKGDGPSLSLKGSKSSASKKEQSNDDKSSDYVKIDSVVKFDPHNLSEHQKEVLSKRKDDIPALYQDLTQSQDFFGSGESTKEDLIAVDPKLVLGPPVGEEGPEESSSKKRKMTDDGEDRECKVAKVDGEEKNEELPRAETETKITDVTEVKEEIEESEIKESAEDTKAIRKSKRQATRRQKEQAISVSNEKSEDIVPSSQVIEDKTEETSTNIIEPVESNSEVTEDIIPATVEEKSSSQNEEKVVRKSTRQVKKREFVFIQQDLRKKSSTPAKKKKEKIEDVSSTGEKQIEEDSNLSVGEDSDNTLRKSKKQKRRQKENVDLDNIDIQESIEDLLARIDKRIEQQKKIQLDNKESKSDSPAESTPEKKEDKQRKSNRRPTPTLSDGNQNKILVEPTEQEEESFQKQEKIREIVSKVKKQVMKMSPEVEKSTDVYEFTGDDDLGPDDMKKSAKKKKKKVAFTRNDYVFKRRKKGKKQSKEERGYPFHITADSAPQTPLSRSNTLRAVPMSQESETITIVITRSPPEAKEEATPSSPKRRSRRKNAEVASEDVVESSQPAEDVAKRRRSRSGAVGEAKAGKRRTRSSSPDGGKKEELPVKTAVRRLSLTETGREEVEKAAGRRVRSQSLDKLNLDSEITFLEEIRRKTVQSADTETVPSDSEKLVDTLTVPPTDEEKSEDLPGSPVTCDTPDRTMELLNNTLDISPINATQEEEEDICTPSSSSKLTNEMSNRRVARLLQMVNSDVSVGRNKWLEMRHSSPSTSRVRKMRMRTKEENLDILTFSREVPSPLTVPSSGILKRKLSSLDETSATPAPKRKRVNFSDPAITDKKIFIKDTEEYEISDQKESTNEVVEEEEGLEKVFLDGLNRREMINTIKEFCDSDLKDMSDDSIKLKSALKCLVQNLNIPEIVDVVSEFLVNFDNKSMTEVNRTLLELGSASKILDQCVIPLIDNVEIMDMFLPKLVNILEKLSSEKLEHFICQLVKISGEERMSDIVGVIKEKLTDKQVEEHINQFDCDKMNELVKNFVNNLEDQKRHEFLVNLMNFASSELPVNKEFVNYHVDMLHNFVKRMND